MLKTERHPTEDELALYYYGESEDAASIREHLDICDGCQDSLRALASTLAVVDTASVPDRGDDYGSQVWMSIRPRLELRKESVWSRLFRPQRLALAGAVASMLVVAFLAGRYWQPGTEPGEPISKSVRERILMVAVGDHLERSQMLLVELVNTNGGSSEYDISASREHAQDLVTANRIYRQTAAGSGEAELADVLEELERLLLEVARGPSHLSASELAEIKKRIEEKGILFKVRVIGSQVKTNENRT